MALHDLTKLKQALVNSLDVSKEVDALNDLSNRISTIKTITNVTEENQQAIDGLALRYKNISEDIAKSVEQTESIIAQINNQITTLAHKLFADSYILEVRPRNADRVREARSIKISEDTEQLLKQRIFLYTNWRYPALEIGCKDGEWTQFLVAADPLYIMDPFLEFIESTASKFPESYQNRLRKYPLVDNNLSMLPKNQFAFVFSWAHFNYVSLDSITYILKQIRELLRPGGVFLFSYNDGDTPAGAAMAEMFSQTYIPKTLLVPTCQSVGFEIVDHFHDGVNISWIEIRKPGTLHTIKAHQVLGEIKRIQN
jgi:SAM-dependent methyltransferase